jgi:AraC-like DNA-binding protein
LWQIAAAGSQSHQIARAIDWLKANFTQPLSIDDLAAQVRMSISTFHHHFRSMTALSPLQFSREYNRLFGAPPLRDITNLRRMIADERA